MAYFFGKLTPYAVTDPETGVVYGENRLADGVTSWHVAAAEHPHPWYMAVDADSRVILCEADYSMAQVPGYDVWGISSEEKNGFTTDTGGTIYGKYWNGTQVVNLPARLLPLSAEQFYGFLESMGEIDNFADQIETVTPTSKKMTCRSQFNNGSSFSYDQVLMQLVAPKVWGPDWATTIAEYWEAAAE